MSSYKKVPAVVVKRLPRYYRYLAELLSSGIERISSNELSERMNCTASQIRQDLNCFGGFGQQGYGYNVAHLHTTIGDLLGLNQHFTVIVIGAGNLGRAIINYAGFEKRGFRFIGAFDANPTVVGMEINGVTVQGMEALPVFCQEHKPDIGVLTIPKDHAQAIAETLENNGIKGIWNFSHMDLKTTKSLPVENVHLSDSLMTLSYGIVATQEGK